MEILIIIPDEKVNAYAEAFADTYHYQTTIKAENGKTVPNPQTKIEFMHAQWRSYIREVYQGHKASEASSARVTAITKAKIFTEDLTVGGVG